MKPNNRKLKDDASEQEIQDYYDYWFNFWYAADDDWCRTEYDYEEYWYEYQNDPVRLRQEKIEEIFNLNEKPTIKDIWPKQ